MISWDRLGVALWLLGVGVILDLAAPGSGRLLPGFAEFLEAIQVTLNAATHESQGAASVFKHTLWVVVELQCDTA